MNKIRLLINKTRKAVNPADSEPDIELVWRVVVPQEIQGNYGIRELEIKFVTGHVAVGNADRITVVCLICRRTNWKIWIWWYDCTKSVSAVAGTSTGLLN